MKENAYQFPVVAQHILCGQLRIYKHLVSARLTVRSTAAAKNQHKMIKLKTMDYKMQRQLSSIFIRLHMKYIFVHATMQFDGFF